MLYTFVELDDRAKRYMVEKIDGVKSLSQAVLSRLDFQRGAVYSIWPEKASRENIYSFVDGAGGGLLRHIEIKKQFLDYVGRFLSSGSDKIVIFENSTSLRSDPWLASEESQLLFYKDEVYHFVLSQQNGPNIVREHHGSNAWRNWVLFSSLPAGTNLESRGDLDASMVDTLAERAEKHAIDAYDLDGYLIWDLLARSSAVGS